MLIILFINNERGVEVLVFLQKTKTSTRVFLQKTLVEANVFSLKKH
jgi:hypothetical protein